VKRRSFLAIAGAFAAATVGSLAVIRTAGMGHFGGQLARLDWFGLQPATRLRYRYRWLDIEPAAFTSYVADYQRHFGRLDRFSIPQPRFFTQFLLSTNFFSARRAQGRPVAYTSFYAPGATPCFNPLAQAPPSDAELRAGRATAIIWESAAEGRGRPSSL
jgi:hypothetical protein